MLAPDTCPTCHAGTFSRAPLTGCHTCEWAADSVVCPGNIRLASLLLGGNPTPDTYCAECAFDRAEGPCVCDSHRAGYHDDAPVESCPLCPLVHSPVSAVETLAIRPGAIRGFRSL